MPRALAAARLALLEYPLSAMAARGDVRPDVEKGLEVGTVRGFAAGQVEGYQVSATLCFSVDFRRKAAARAAEGLPPFAPAADTRARTTVESNIWIRCADGLIAANVSKKASNTPALLNRSKRFHALFQCTP